MDASAYALAHGIRSTRGALSGWKDRPWPVARRWLLGSVLAASFLLVAIWVIAGLTPSHGHLNLRRPPFLPGGYRDAVRIFSQNMLVLALHAMACVAGFIAGGSLPLQAQHSSGSRRAV